MARTYLPRLVALLKTVCRYIVRYRAIIESFLTTEQQTYLAAVVTACEQFVLSIELPEGV